MPSALSGGTETENCDSQGIGDKTGDKFWRMSRLETLIPRLS